MFSLPPEDRRLSPYTGWTRAHWEAVADGLLAAVEPYRSADGASIRLPGRASWSDCDGMEGFARTFLIAAFRVAGGGPAELLEPYRRGFVSGPASWPGVVERHQPMVECASLALGLWLTREHLWDTLEAGERERLAAYLATVYDREPANNNWWLFPLTVGGFLVSVGMRVEDSRAAVERGLARIEPWYVGDGWYTDGDNRSFDHYNGWALHFYPLLYDLLSGVHLPVHRERLREFLAGYALTFGADGQPLYQGRSLTYRFAAAASLMLGAVTGDSPLSPGATRRLASGSIRYFLERGALDAGGLLTLGYHGPHEHSLQPYSGSGSPYWAAKAFAGLLAPADHPLWTATEEPGPEGLLALPGPGLVVRNAGGIARVLNHGGQRRVDDVLYDRYAYSTHTAPTAPDELPDNHFGLVREDGTVTARGVIEPRGAGTTGELTWAASAGTGPQSVSVTGAGSQSASVVTGAGSQSASVIGAGPQTASATGAGSQSAALTGAGTGSAAPAGARTESVSVLRGEAEVRVHRVAPGSRVRQTGWALPRATASIGDLTVTLTSPDAPSSRLTGLYGYTTASAQESAEGTAFGAPALVPVLDGVADDGWAVSMATLGAAGETLPSVKIADDQVTITWPDGIGLTLTTHGPIT